MQNVVIKNDLKWYDKKSTWLGIGIVGGFIGGILINNKQYGSKIQCIESI